MTMSTVQFSNFQADCDRPSLSQGDRPIIFFDGECVMCNGFVDVMLRLDPEAKILLAPLQGKTAHHYLPPLPNDRQDWTIYYLDESGLSDRSEAFANICQRLGGWLLPFTLIRVMPRSIRDKIYNWVARNRYNFFGKKETCRIPKAEEQAHFLA